MPDATIRQINQYEIHHKLGAGGFGVVFYATDTRLRRSVVIKMLHRSADAALRAKMLEEARLASAIEHPNVCAIYEAGEHEGQPYLVMQYVPGQTLQQLLDGSALALRLALSIGIQVADGLAAAHAHGILHRDLKPSNVMITDAGLVKILDFGMARRKTPEPDLREGDAEATPVAEPASSRFGTAAYMAPEQFVTRRSTEQSDLFALGVLLYQMTTGTHPFWMPGLTQPQLVQIIQNRRPDPPSRLRAELPEALDEIAMKALAKQPAQRYGEAVALRDALKTLMKSLGLEDGSVPGEASTVLPVPAPDREEGRAGLLSALAERLMPSKPAPPPKNSVAVLPFQEVEPEPGRRFYGLALADAVAARLARLPALVVRPPGTLLSATDEPLDPFEAGRRLAAESVLTGTFARTGEGFTLSWHLLDVASQAIRAGGALAVPSLDLIALQSRVADDVFAALRTAAADAPEAAAGTPAEALSEEVSEAYLEARALLTSFALRSSHGDDLAQALAMFEDVVERAPEFAPAHAGLGIAHLRSVRNGFGGAAHLLAAQRHLDRALDLDPGSIEAQLNRAYTLLWRGEKETARHEIQRLLAEAPHDAEVHLGAGLGLMLDGLLDEALRAFGTALRLNPALAGHLYNLRGRIYLYQGRLGEALHEIDRGLALDPRHFHLRTTLGYWLFRSDRLEEALFTLERVLADHPTLRLAAPTLAICYVAAGRVDDAEALVTDALREAAEADGEMAYRLATYHAVRTDADAAMAGLRQAVYLGNENYPWFATNPAWAPLHEHEPFRRLLAELKKTHARNRALWRPTLEGKR